VVMGVGVEGLDLWAVTDQRCEPRDSGRFGAIVVTSQGHDLFEVIAPVYRGGGVPATRAERRRRATGWVVGLFDAEPILRAAVAGQRGVSVSLGREHASVPETRIPTRTGAAFRPLVHSIPMPRAATYTPTP